MKHKQNLHPFFARFLENSIDDELDGICAGQISTKFPSDFDEIDPPPPGIIPTNDPDGEVIPTEA